MKAFRITDYLIPAVILQTEGIEKDIYEDGASFSVPDVVNEFWIGVEENETIIGCYRLHQMGRVFWQIHAYILPEYRKMYSIRASKVALKWVIAHVMEINTVICLVPAAHENVASHAQVIGFNKVGTIENSYMWENKLIDQDILAISKSKIESL